MRSLRPAGLKEDRHERSPLPEPVDIAHRTSSPTPPTPYLLLPGTAREALSFYAGLFGGTAQLHSFAEFGHRDGPVEAIAHGRLVDSPVALYVADAAPGEPSFRAEGLMLSLLGTADAPVLRRWFAGLAEEGTVLDDLSLRPWGAYDGRVSDRHGISWLIGFETAAAQTGASA